jgi:hypothetical protein
MSTPLDIEKLLKALDNEDNAGVVQLNYEKIAADKNNILQQLHLTREQLKTLNKQLKPYRYVDSFDDLRYGSYIRWISLKKKDHKDKDNNNNNNNNNIVKLTNGGILCHIKQVEEDIHIVCKNSMGFLFQLNMTENIIFQKLNSQEQVILSALKYIDG